MAPPSHYHRHAPLVRRPYDFVVALGATRLDNRSHPGLGQHLQTVGEGEEGVARHQGPRRPLARVFYRDLRRGHPAGLTGPDADRSTVSGEHDSIALHALGDLPSKEELTKLIRRKLRAGYPLVVR